MKVYSWGANTAGQLGHGYMSEQVSVPTVVNALDFDCKCSTTKFPQISGGGSHTIILDGVESTAEEYIFHHFGLMATKLECPREQNLPKVPLKFQQQNYKVEPEIVEQIVCGWDFSLFLDSVGTLYSVGEDNYSQLGRNTSGLNSTTCSAEFSPSWAKIPLPMQKVIQISAGMRHAAAITSTGSLLSWGDNSKGQTGLNLDSKVIVNPTPNTDLNIKPLQVRCSRTSTIVLGEDGYFYGCGLNKFGILGEQESSQPLFPKFTKLFRIEDESLDTVIQDFQCGWNHVLVLLGNGRVMSWGRNNFCQLGRPCCNASFDYDPNPGFVQGLPEKIVSIACGSEHNLVLGVSGTVYSWGWNEHDNCGISAQNHVVVIQRPTKVPLPTYAQVISIACGGGSSFVLTK